VFFNRLGELRDRTYENQQHRTNGLSLVVAAIVLWNTVYLGKAIQKLKRLRGNLSEELLTHLSPLGWEHINLTGNYVWRPDSGVRNSRLRPLRLKLNGSLLSVQYRTNRQVTPVMPYPVLCRTEWGVLSDQACSDAP